MGRWPYGPAHAVATAELGGTGVIDGTPYSFLSSGSVVLILDMTDPTNPTKVGEVVTPVLVWGLTLFGDLLLVADGEAGLRVVDVSAPASPAEVGFLDTPGGGAGAYEVAVSGDLALVGDRTGGLRIIDISDPTDPVEVGFFETPDSAFGVAISGDLALVASRGGLYVIDFSDPTNPTEVGFLAMFYGVGVAISGDLVLVADFLAGLRIVDFSDPSAAAEVGFFAMPRCFDLRCGTLGRLGSISRLRRRSQDDRRL